MDQRIDDRRRSTEESLWALPGLSIAAQAFIFSAGLAHETSGGARILAGVIGLVIAVATAYVRIYFGSRWLVYYLWTDPAQSLDACNLLEQAGGVIGDRKLGRMARWGVKPHWIGAIEAWALVLGVLAVADVLMILDGAGVWDIVS